MARFIVVAALVALASTSALAQTTANPDFVTVDAVIVSGSRLTIAGVVEEGQAPVSRALSFSDVSGGPTSEEQLNSCKELAFVAMSKPGQYRFRAVSGIPNVCGLVRANP
jgi:hypothetical protein